MSYSMLDYFKEEATIFDKIYPKVKHKKEKIARKSYTCSNPDCNKEIHKNELVIWFKPRPTYNKRTGEKTYYRWFTRCKECDPGSYEEIQKDLQY